MTTSGGWVLNGVSGNDAFSPLLSCFATVTLSLARAPRGPLSQLVPTQLLALPVTMQAADTDMRTAVERSQKSVRQSRQDKLESQERALHKDAIDRLARLQRIVAEANSRERATFDTAASNHSQEVVTLKDGGLLKRVSTPTIKAYLLERNGSWMYLERATNNAIFYLAKRGPNGQLRLRAKQSADK